MKNFLYVANEFPPSSTPGVYRTAKFARYLPEHGFSPLVITPRRPPVAQKDESLLREIPEGVRVFRTGSLGFTSWADRTKDTVRRRYIERENSPVWNLLRRANDRLFFMDKQIGWTPFAFRKARRLVRRGEADRALITAFPYSAFFVGYWLQQREGVPWVADYRDALTLIEEGFDAMTPARLARCEKWEERFLKSAGKSVFVSETIRRRHLEKYPWLPPEKTEVIPNGFDPGDFEKSRPRTFESRTLLFLGTIYEGQVTIEPLLQALASLKNEGRIDARRFSVRFAGNLPQVWLRRVEELRLENIFEYDGYLEHDLAVETLLGADALYLLLASGEKWDQRIPGKIFEYLSSGAPILGAVPEGGESARLLEAAEAGPIVPPDDVRAHKEAIVAIAEGRWKRADPDRRRRFLEPYTRHALAGRMAGLLNGLTPAP